MTIFAEVHQSNSNYDVYACVRARGEGEGEAEVGGGGIVLCCDTVSIQSKFLKIANKEANNIPENEQKGSICRFRLCQE